MDAELGEDRTLVDSMISDSGNVEHTLSEEEFFIDKFRQMHFACNLRVNGCLVSGKFDRYNLGNRLLLHSYLSFSYKSDYKNLDSAYGVSKCHSNLREMMIRLALGRFGERSGKFGSHLQRTSSVCMRK